MYSLRTGTVNMVNTAYTVYIFNQTYFTQFIDYMDCRPTTLKSYITCIKQFAQYLQLNNIDHPTRQTIKDYKAELDHTPLKAGTKAQYIRAVKHFFKWTAAEGIYPNIADNIKAAKVQRDTHKKSAFSDAAIKQIEQKIDRTSEEGKRLYAMFLLCTVNGLRTIELNRADISDIETIENRHYISIQGKGRDEKDQKEEIITPVYNAIRDYLAARTDNPSRHSPLFVSTSNRSKGQRIAKTTISGMFKELFKAAGYDSEAYTAHSLRHTCATAAIKSGLDLYETQKLLRHADPATTEIYIHDDDRTQTESKGRTAIYKQLFGDGQRTTAEELEHQIKTLTPEQQEKLLIIINQLKGN